VIADQGEEREVQKEGGEKRNSRRKDDEGQWQ
jgi:hypothetical protein